MWFLIVLAAVSSYLLGNLNGAVIISSVFAKDDVRNHGSGNAGLTNFIRNYGVSRALLVIAIDAGKAVLACLLSGLLLKRFGSYQQGSALGGLFVMLGHAFPAFLGFRGGKGILSGLFVAIMVDWRVALIILGVFAAVYFVTRYVSLASVCAAAAFGIGFATLHFGDLPVMTCGILMSCLAIFMHRSNIVRLCNGEERKTDLFSKGKQQ